MRLLIVLAGLPEPTVNVIVRAEDGSWRMRFDLCYVEQRLIVEYDGRRHADSRNSGNVTSTVARISIEWTID